MKHFIVFMVFIFSGLFLAVFYKQRSQSIQSNLPVVRVFSTSSFTSKWGPGPWLKTEFEKTCNCIVQYADGADATMLLQKLKSTGRNEGVDVVLSFDQYEIESMQKSFEWRKLDLTNIDFQDEIKKVIGQQHHFIPYDWGVLAFVLKKSKTNYTPKSIDDLLNPALKGQISLQDPRTSSTGLQFLLWLIHQKGESEAFEFLKKLNLQVHSYSPSWSSAYGLFQKDVVQTTFSYTTSPVYHVVEEKDTDVMALEFSGGHPVQYEFVGVPTSCKNCELAESFVKLMMSPEGQKTIMERNYMFPAVKGVKDSSVFASVPQFKISEMNVIPSLDERERILKRWSVERRSE